MKKSLQLKELLKKYQHRTATEQERKLLENWYNSQSAGLREEVDMQEMEAAKTVIWNKISVNIAPLAIKPSFRLWRAITAAASIILVAAIGSYMYISSDKKQDFDQLAIQNNIVPGNNKAVLTLADGTKVDLTNSKSGQLVMQGSVQVAKTSDGQLVYQFSERVKGESGFNSVATPIGGQYQVVLPDGTKVWLNAASSLKFPVSFAALTDRKVELTGQAYFEVAKDQKRPFLVSSRDQTVEVLGTHFDVNAYGDDGKIRTTLLEGSVKVSATGSFIKLVPGQQSRLSASEFAVANVNTEEAVAWKEGYFRFSTENLETIMKSVSRWYGVEVEFKDEEVKSFAFWGRVSRFENVGELLRVLERTEKVHFKIEGKKIIVSK